MQHASVKKLFKEQVKHYSKEGQYQKLPLFRVIIEWLRKKKYAGVIQTCEFGGGNGQLLHEIQKVFPRASLTNVEIVEDYKRFLVSPKIKFVVGSILEPDFLNKTFNVVIIRDVLHHLVGKTYQETLLNQKLALTNLKRLVKPGGAIFIEELTNESEIATRAIYYLTRLNTKIGIHIPSVFVSRNVIVAFFTSRRLLALCKQIFGKYIIKVQESAIQLKWYFVLLHLFGGAKKIILTIQT